MYVAATRARETLWLSGAPALTADGELKPAAHSLLAVPVAGAGGALRAAQPRPPPMRGAGPERTEAAAPARGLDGAGARRQPPRCRICRWGRWRWSRRSSAGWARRSARSARSCTATWRDSPQATAAGKRPRRSPRSRMRCCEQLARHGVPERRARRCRRADPARTDPDAWTMSAVAGCWIPAHRDAHGELALTGLSDGQAAHLRHRPHVHRCGRHALGDRLQDQPPRGRRASRRSWIRKWNAIARSWQGTSRCSRASGPSRCAPDCTSRCWGRSAKSRDLRP